MDIAAEVRRVIAKVLKRPVQDLSNETKLQDLGAESLDFIEIVFEIEETFQNIPRRMRSISREDFSG